MQAISAFTEAISFEPSVFVAAYRGRAEAYQSLGRHEKALADRNVIASIPRARPAATRGPDVESEEFIRRMSAERDEKRKSGIQEMVIGALFLVGGSIATIVSYNSTAPGGTYFVWWGAMLFGGFDLIKGFLKMGD